MTDEDVAIGIAEHRKEIGSLKHRVTDLEKQQDTIQSLALSINELAINMGNMLDEQKKQGKRLEKLENEPVERWNTAKKTMFTSTLSTLSGGFVGLIIAMVVWYIRSGGI